VGKTTKNKEETATFLFKNIQQEKQKLIHEKIIMDKKDKHIYPIINIPFIIPDTWLWCYLSDLSIIQEGPGLRKHQYTNHGVQFLTVTNILENSVNLNKSQKYISLEEYNNKYTHFTINKGDIVTACSGASWGKSAIYNLNDNIILNTSTLRLRFFNDLGNNKYLYYLTKTSYFKQNLNSHSTGQQPNYGYSHYSKIPIPLPPLQEQEKIVTLLDEAFLAIEKAKTNAELNLQNAKELFESYLQDVFENHGEGWEEKTLEEICKITSKLIDPKEEQYQNLIHVGAGNIESEKGTLIKLQTAKEENLISGKFLFDSEMVLYSKIRPYLMKVVKCDFKGLCSADIYPLVPAKEHIIQDFLYHLLLSKNFTEYAIEGSQRAGMPKVNRKHLFEYTFNCPPLQEQKTIVKKLNTLQAQTKKLESIYTQKHSDLDELKKSILQKAFNGELL